MITNVIRDYIAIDYKMSMLMEAALHVMRHYVTFGPMLCLVVVFAIVLVLRETQSHDS